MGAPRALVLVGLRASGKTTVGRLVAERLGWPFVDTDDAIAKAVGVPAGSFLAAVGEGRFRTREREVVETALAGAAPVVVATGGGAPTIPAVQSLLAAADLFVVWLDAPDEELARRLRGSPGTRPPLVGGDAAAEIPVLRARRAEAYARVADLVVDTGSDPPAAVAGRIAAALLAL